MTLLAVLATIATSLAGHPATVRCGGPSPLSWRDASGWAYVGGTEAGLSAQTCRRLERAREGSDGEPGAWAILVLGHETAHLHGIADEQVADCWGLRWFKRVAADLGVSAVRRMRMWATIDGGMLQRAWCR